MLIATDHSAYDYAFIVRHSRLVVDTAQRHQGGTRTAREDREDLIRS